MLPSSAHQRLVLWLARKMVADGYLIAGYEGPTEQGGLWNRLPAPFEIAGVRPDVFGMRAQGTWMAFGEAKTAEDVFTQHTLRQLRVFGHLRDHRNGEHCPLYIAVPRSAAWALDRALVSVGLINASYLLRLHIPDCLLVEGSREQR
jgi:hypothetical protein